MSQKPVQRSYPGVFVEEVRTSVKVIPGVETSTSAVSSQGAFSDLLRRGFKIVHTQIESGGMALLLAKGKEHVLVRMSDYRDGSSVEGHMIVTFIGKLS